MGCYTQITEFLVKLAFTESHARSDQIVALEPNHIHPRMMVQLSKFTLHGVPEALNKRKDADRYLVHFDIPATEKEGLRNELRWLGICESNLFPDLEHLARELNSRQWLDLTGPPQN